MHKALNVDNKTDPRKSYPKYLKISVLVVALGFLVYHIYWAIYTTSWFCTFTDIILGQTFPVRVYHLSLLIFQEYAAIMGYYLILIGGIFTLQSAILFNKNDSRYTKSLGKAFIFSSLFYILLLPSSLRHFVGVATTSQATGISNTYSIYVGFSCLLQALLIGIPLFILGRKLLKPQNHVGFWSYASLLWVYALSPLGPKQASLISTIGAANSLLMLLIAGIITTIACIDFNRNKTLNKKLASIAIILVGSYAIVYALVSFWVPIYFSFMYLTEIWLIVLPILGIAILKLRSTKENKAITQ
jgi:hypothetical protein